MSYLLDANVFIQAKNQYYGLDIVPAFWDWLVDANADGKVFSIEKVAQELLGYGDELSDWTRNRVRAGGFFLSPDVPVLDSLREVAKWAQAQPFTKAVVNEFFQAADYYLVAHAHAHGHTAVTQEVYEPASTRKIKIPNACQALGVPWINTYAMLRAEGARFVSS
ncbi:MAG: DUF4411 family protein [Candidatus Velamenicoccus archaeovorus]